jgi:hypothetical protein
MRCKHHYVNIVNPHGGRLNTLQIRIISELVATQYPHCKASPRDDNWFMQVTLRDRVIEDQVRVYAKYSGDTPADEGI